MKKPRLGNPKLAVAYCRVSTDADTQSNGLEVQRGAIQQWAEREGVTFADGFIEEVSGGAPLDKRPVLMAAMAAVAAHGARFLVVQKIDRFSRDPVTAALAEAELQRSGACLACADGMGDGKDPTSLLVRDMLLAVARFEKAMIRARIVAAMGVKRRNGERISREPPYGFRFHEGSLVEHIPEQLAIAFIRMEHRKGMSLRKIIAYAYAHGFRSRNGKPLSLASVHKILGKTEE